MKKILLIGIVWILALAAAGCSASRSAVKSEIDVITAGQVDKMLDERMFKVDFQRALPASAPSIILSSPYFISVIGDRVESFLPYIGVVYSVPNDGGEGLRFAAPISNYSENVKNNGGREITFEAKTGEDIYKFMLTVFPLGECNLRIAPGQKQSISFSGRIDLEPQFEAVRAR